jgi:hypothetical protein
MDVVKRVPAVVIGILIDDKIVGAVPAPIGADGPIPISDLKIEAARKPEAVVVAVEALDAIAVRRAKAFEATVFEGMIDVKAPVTGTGVAVPVVIVDMRSGVDVPSRVTFRLGSGVSFAARWRSLRDAPLIGARRIFAALLPVLLAALLAGLGQDGECQERCQSKWKNQA